MPSNIVLITTAFPSSSVTEEVFVTPELEALAREFDRVIIVPLMSRGAIIDIDIPGVTVDYGIARHIFTRFKPSKLPYLLAPYTLGKIGRIIKESDSAGQFVSKCFFCMNVASLRGLFKKLAKRHGLLPEDTVYYTFWFDHATTALAEMSRDFPLTFVSRAHGYDVYDLAYGRNRVRFLRDFTLSRITSLYPVARKGMEYLDRLYPGHRDKMNVRLLGSVKPDKSFITRCHDAGDDTVTILSVARVSPEKRVLLNLDFVKSLALMYPDKRIEWIHVGDGPLMNELRDRCSADRLPANLKIDLKGSLPNAEIHDIYKENTIDWTLLLSESEGTPITICESFSYGVPVIATRVGGVPDMIDAGSGVLVDADMPVSEMAEAICPYISSHDSYLKLKAGAFSRWLDNYDSASLRQKFAKELASLLNN